jgi:uncharacterized protein (UPF0261 family)
VATETPVVVLVGTLDTKGNEYAFVRDRLRAEGVDVTVVDVGVLGEPAFAPDITREEVARAGGTDLAALIATGNRGAAVTAMGEGAAAGVARLHAEGRLDAVFGLGGSGGSSLVARAVRDLPVGVPKLLVSTVASGDTRPYVGTTDLTMMYSVVDIAGINSLSRRILTNAAAAVAGMARAAAVDRTSPSPSADGEGLGGRDSSDERPLVAATMFGVTTPAVTVARDWLEAKGYEVLVFHATGAGGDTMEALVRSGIVTGVLDITTTELADELAGGICPAGPGRLEGAGERGLPQVVSLGALDMVNFGPRDTVPPRYADRQLLVHNPTITLMRTSVEECAELGRRLAERLNRATGPLTVFIPTRGVSLVSTEGQPFHDPEADAALFDALRAGLDPGVDVRVMDTDLNDPAFALAMAETFDAHYQRWAARQATMETAG